jgi:predicted RecB family nuclease
MRTYNGDLLLSASDLSNHLSCPHSTSLDLAFILGELQAPTWIDPLAEVLRERGFQHERAYLEHLRNQGLDLCTLPEENSLDLALEQTRAAMAGGAEVIVQATLVAEPWQGRADVLVRTGTPSALWPWSYEVVDTKLARETRAGTILQLCLYSEMVACIQGTTPENMYVVVPGREFQPETYRCDDYMAYHRLSKRRLQQAVGSERSNTYPEPCDHCDICKWWQLCDRRRRDDDHLSLVAGISRQQRRELADWGVSTLASLASLPVPLERRPARGSGEALVKVREQARVQFTGREQSRPVYELLPLEVGQGLSRLPDPSLGDIFLDLEADPFAGDGGFVYLFGMVAPPTVDGEPEYEYRWSFTPQEERDGFEWFVDAVMHRWERHPDLHIYHFAPFEPSTLKRLMGRYGTREDELDRMLRAGLFVDLCAIAKRSVRASVESYSIKQLEQFYDFERAVPLREASLNLHGVERTIALGEVAGLRPEALRTVQGYNRDDCLSNLRLRDWLEQVRAECISQGQEIPRPEARAPEPTEALTEWQQQIAELKARLAGDVPFDATDRTPEEQASWILSELLEWHRREAKAVWWEYFRLRELPAEELLYERRALYGLEFVEELPLVGRARVPVHRYRFVEQEFDIRDGDELNEGETKVGTVVAVSNTARTIDIKKTGETVALHPRGVFAFKKVNTQTLQDSLRRIAEWTADSGVDSAGLHRAGRDLLLGRSPRLLPGTALGPEGDLALSEEDVVDAARRLVLALDGGVLAIQGPPGAGKTYAGSRMICDLLRAGRKVGVTAVSHKVIRNLLQKVVEAGHAVGYDTCCYQKPEGSDAEPCPGVVYVKDNEDVETRLCDPGAGSLVVGGTAWLWSRPALMESLDVLFIDEAGQMSLADVLAASQAARNLVLLGDPQQLEQPIQGSHPEGVAVSALEHLLQGHKTMPSDRGLFLGQTWRLHPSICAFTSELFYENRLASRPGLEAQEVQSALVSGAGLWVVEAPHQGNQNSSVEEAEIVSGIGESFAGANWRNADGRVCDLRLDDILIVCPYNAQVSKVAESLHGARVGTVDKFQGQEAPVVIYSMATSAPEDAPRGMEFLYSLNRLNVATSRAKCATILVASPLLFEPDCRTPRQMQLANAFCRYLEMASSLRLQE